MLNRRNLIIAAVAFLLGVLAALVYLREPTIPLSSEALTQARKKWSEASIRSYHLKYRMHGGLYEVDVQDGLVSAITVNGQTLSIAQPGAYSVDGLFDILQMELENMADPSSPMGTSPGNILARVRFNGRLGYPERYLRGGTYQSNDSSLDMLEFHPTR